MFDEANRFPNFGEVITELKINGIRCHSSTVIPITSPIVAFCGLNGTGKSTILQLAAAAYRPPASAAYSISDFMVVSALDPQPFKDTASVEFRFWQESRSTRPLTLSRSRTSTRWRGYSRRRQRSVYLAGIGMYLPRCEQPSFASRARFLTVSGTSDVVGRIRDCTCKILGTGYDRLISSILNIRDRRGGRISSVQRGGMQYSEAHMGFGEARTIHIVSTLESLPPQSLVLLEEPETSLHLSAQHEFGRYLVDVAIERKHQIFVTTHSEFLLQSLPSASRIYLERIATGIRAIPGLTAIEAKSLMALGHVRALTVLVEDPCAKEVLVEIIRRHDPVFLRSLSICVGGDKDKIRNTVHGLRETNLRIAAVRDADKEGAPAENIFKLPGTLPPEKEIFQNGAFRDHVRNTYGVELADFATELVGIDHHDWFDRLADRIQKSHEALVSEAAKAYVASLPETETSTLVQLLKEATRS